MKIVTDSAADLPADEVKTLGIQVAPLKIHFPDGELSADQISPDQFYTRLREMEPDIPKTSQPSSGEFSRLYKNMISDGEEILSIHISSGLSGTVDAARIGADDHQKSKITIIDSLTLSGGQRFQVLAAALGARLGWSMSDILKRLKQVQAASEVVYTLETLSYLSRGGRIGRVQALAGSLLKLKPIITVDKKDGKYNTLGKGRTLIKSMDLIGEHFMKIYSPEVPVWVTVLHGQLQIQAENLAKLLHGKMNVARMEVLRISPVLGVHTGPGIVGAAIVPAYLMEDFG